MPTLKELGIDTSGILGTSAYTSKCEVCEEAIEGVVDWYKDTAGAVDIKHVSASHVDPVSHDHAAEITITP